MRKLIILPAGDFIFSSFALLLAFSLRLGEVSGRGEIFGLTAAKFVIFGLVLLFVSFLFELYDREKNLGKKEVLVRVFIEIIISSSILSSLYYAFPVIKLGRGILLLSVLSFALFQFLWHVSFRAYLMLPGSARKVLILGTGPLAQKIGEIVKSTNHSYTLTGYVNLPSESVCVPMDCILVNGKDNNLVDTARKERADKIVVSLSERRGVFPLEEVMNCKFNGIEVVDAPSFYEEVTGKLFVEGITPSWFIFSDGFRLTRLRHFSKRIIDIFLSSVGLIIILPLFPLIALIIKIDSVGPILLRQLRIGKEGNKFILYKFRTMYDNAENETGVIWAQKKDPRVTRFGKFLRKTRFDEFPQFYNVLKGDMSIVGPRPERPEFVEKLKKLVPYYSERHVVKPGITGWAQIRYSYGSSVKDAREKLRYDLYYIKNISLLLDFMIIMETIKVMLFGRGAR
ncbi:MAG: TIGR03013 family XrtA/PEP-CTERM system glycosyltransferase [Nitrospirota bacterium]